MGDCNLHSAFNSFRFCHQNETHIFKSYERLKIFRLSVAPRIYKPLRRLNDFIELVKEQKLERKYNLPTGYLSGLFFQIRPYSNAKLVARKISQDFNQMNIQRNVDQAVSMMLPDLTYKVIRTELKDLNNELIAPQLARIKADLIKRTDLTGQASKPSHDSPSALMPLHPEVVEAHPMPQHLQEKSDEYNQYYPAHV